MRRGARYYVTVFDDGRCAWALGPFSSHADALSRVGDVRQYLLETDPRSWFYSYGTAATTARRINGRLNARLFKWSMSRLVASQTKP